MHYIVLAPTVSFYQPSFLFTYTAVCSGNINSLTHFRSWQNYDLKLEHSSHSLKYWNANDADSKRQRRWLTVKAKLNDPPPAELEVLISFFFYPSQTCLLLAEALGSTTGVWKVPVKRRLALFLHWHLLCLFFYFFIFFVLCTFGEN